MLTLSAKIRTQIGRENQEVRLAGSIPAVLYGPGVANENLAVDAKEFVKLFRQAGKSLLVALKIEGKKSDFMVLVNDVDFDPLSGQPTHVDFYQPDLTKEIEAEVPLSFEGESAAVKDFGGTLVKNFSEITVKALPADLPREIKVDISKLATFENTILVRDLPAGEKVELLKNPDEIVALVVEAQKIEEELEKPIEENVEDVAKVEKKEKDVVSEEESAPSKPSK
jgi:large subunit ribosomal protein L25